MGVSSWPELDALDDTNEMTNPTVPQVRSLDGFNPHDPAIDIIMSGGITTSLVLPVSYPSLRNHFSFSKGLREFNGRRSLRI